MNFKECFISKNGISCISSNHVKIFNKLVVNEGVAIKRITNDRYGRTVGELFKNEVNIQELIVKKGYGKIYKKYAYQCEWSKK